MKNKYKFKVKEKLLEKEEEYNLISSWQNTKNNNALNKLLKSYKKLVVSISKKFISYGLPQEDLIQEGTMGLMYAIEKFDISKGFRLSTYSHWWIRAMIQDYIIKNWSIVKNGSTASQKILFFSFNKIKKLINFDSLKTMDINEVEKISKILNMKPLDVEHLESRLKMGDQSLNQTITHNDSTVELIDLLKDESDSQHHILQKNNDEKIKQKWILKAINNLNEREKFIINSRKLNEEPKTLNELSKKLKISKERVRQIEFLSLKKLKKNILEISNETKDFFIN
tara:strand:- start:409 stop:1257 length:849 start_codon:yes stop_codon:yes gene_type:complete